MSFKNFLIWIIKSLIILIIATLIFSAITLDFPNLLKGVFGDIFAYASPDAQKQVVSKLAETCSSLEQGEELASLNQICANASLLKSMKENCQYYGDLKRIGIRVEDEAQVGETCLLIESGELERQCNEIQRSSLLPDFSKIGALCRDYKAGKINDKEFFFNVISGAIPSQMQIPNIGFLERYNQAIKYLNTNKILYFVILLILTVVLYILTMDVKLFVFTLTQILFSIGILIMLPYLAIIAYEKFVGFDTTSILGGIFGIGVVFDFKAIISVVLLLFLRTYNSLIITLGIVFLAIGAFGKIYNIASRKEIKLEKEVKLKKKDKKMDKLFGESKESIKKDKKK